MRKRCIILVTTSLFCCGALCPTAAAESFTHAGASLVVRYDDYAPRDTSSPDVPGLELERRLFELFKRYDAKLIVGVIPEPVPGVVEGTEPYAGDPEWLSRPDDDWVALLRRYVESGVVIPALHGHSHKRATPSGHRPGEFIGREYDWMVRVLTEGRVRLSAAVGRSVDVFVPPWNAWDRNTARALEEAGFTWLSPDLHHASLPEGDLLVLPQTTGNPAALVGDAPFSDSYAVLVTHPFDFTGDGGQASWARLEALLAHARSVRQVRCHALDAWAEDPQVQRRRFAAAVTSRRANKKLRDMIGGGSLAREPSPWVYPPASMIAYADAARRRLALAGAVTAAVGALAGWFVSAGARRWRRGGSVVVALGALATASLIAGAWLIADSGYHVRGLRLQAILVGLGGTLGAAVAARRSRRVSAAAHETGERGTLGATGADAPPGATEPAKQVT